MTTESNGLNGWAAWFPGQGSQHVGMAKDLLDQFQTARLAFEEASDGAQLNLRKLCLDGPDSDLALTENTQPCLLAASVAAYRVAAAEFGFRPHVAAGHSLGEYSALVCAGAFPLVRAAHWVRQRGAAMQRAVPQGQGTMAAVLGLDDAAVAAACKQATVEAELARKSSPDTADWDVPAWVEPANFNAPGQVVVAGSTDGVAALVRLVKSGATGGGKAMALSVSAPFHSKLMRPARDAMATLFAKAEPSDRPHALHFPYVPNRTARTTAEAGVVFELLIEQVDHPVLWKQSVEHLLASGITRAIEFGPGKVLQGLAKRIPFTNPQAPSSPESGIENTPVVFSAIGVSDAATLKLADLAWNAKKGTSSL